EARQRGVNAEVRNADDVSPPQHVAGAGDLASGNQEADGRAHVEAAGLGEDPPRQGKRSRACSCCADQIAPVHRGHHPSLSPAMSSHRLNDPSLAAGATACETGPMRRSAPIALLLLAACAVEAPPPDSSAPLPEAPSTAGTTILDRTAAERLLGAEGITLQ